MIVVLIGVFVSFTVTLFVWRFNLHFSTVVNGWWSIEIARMMSLHYTPFSSVPPLFNPNNYLLSVVRGRLNTNFKSRKFRSQCVSNVQFVFCQYPYLFLFLPFHIHRKYCRGYAVFKTHVRVQPYIEVAGWSKKLSTLRSIFRFRFPKIIKILYIL